MTLGQGHYKGILRKGATKNTVHGEIADAFGWIIHVTGIRNEDGSFELYGFVGDPPNKMPKTME